VVATCPTNYGHLRPGTRLFEDVAGQLLLYVFFIA
jgi:hypothetical protein